MSVPNDAVDQLTATDVVAHHSDWTVAWHDAATVTDRPVPWSHIETNHRSNFDLWHEEDVARRDDIDAERIKTAKRAIDVLNQARNDAMERVDEWVGASLLARAADTVPLHTETPGMIVDRLSILSLKRFHMGREALRESATAEHRAKCAAKHSVIETQLFDLSRSFQDLLDQLRAGERRFKTYRQFKMYNDPSLNPQLHSPTRIP